MAGGGGAYGGRRQRWQGVKLVRGGTAPHAMTQNRFIIDAID